MAQYKGASRDAHRAKTLEKRRERQKEEMELLKNKLAKVNRTRLLLHRFGFGKKFVGQIND